VAIGVPIPGAVHEKFATAAIKLDALATQAHEFVSDNDEWGPFMEGVLGGPVGDFCGMMSPDVAIALADFLAAYARAFGDSLNNITGANELLAVVENILKGDK
jgi:hypothetical protein